MFLEALEILNSAGQDEDTFVTDFGIYKITYILTVYLPIALSTFLLSQEYLGDKIACFAPDSFSENHAEALNEYCWNNGFWVSEGVVAIKNLYTQPHRFYPLYLPVQAIIFTSPIVLWNILTKSHLLAVLRGTEEFLEDLLETVQKGHDDPEETSSKAKELMRQFHQTCVQAAQKSGLAKIGIVRVTWEMFLLLFTILMQFFIYNHKVKDYQCSVPEIDLEGNQILCTVPILDLLDAIWSFNLSAMLLALCVNFYMVFRLYQMHFSEFQPLFYNSLPYGDTDDFNEKVSWDSRWTKDSYRLLTRIFAENNSIMTKAYVLMAMKPQEDDQISEREKMQQMRLRRLSKIVQGKNADASSTDEESDAESKDLMKAGKLSTPVRKTSIVMKNGHAVQNGTRSFESTNGRAASFESTNGRPVSFDSTNGRPASFESTNGRVTSFDSANGSHELLSHTANNGFAHDSNYGAMSSGRGSYSSFPSEDYSAFHPISSSSRHNVHWEEQEAQESHVEDLMNDNLRQRVHIVTGSPSDPIKPKLGDFSVLTILLIAMPLVILSFV